MAKTSATLDVIYNLSMFKDKFEQLENESLNKGGTANGINQQVEYYANLANAVVYTATNVLTSSALEKFLKDYGDILNISSDLSNYTGNIVGDKVRNYLYNNIDEIDYQILVEADFLVNIMEDGLSKEAALKAYESIFKTTCGKMICREMFDFCS